MALTCERDGAGVVKKQNMKYPGIHMREEKKMQ